MCTTAIVLTSLGRLDFSDPVPVTAPVRREREGQRLCNVTEMSKRYVVKPLGEGQVLQAYPLVQAAVPHLTLDQWMDYAEGFCGGKRATTTDTGIMSAQNPEGYIYGIYCHEVETDIQHGRVLKIINLVTANLYDSAGIMDKMIDSMIDKARDNDCVAIQVYLPEEAGRSPQPVEGTVSMLRGAGYRLAWVALSKPIEKSDLLTEVVP